MVIILLKGIPEEKLIGEEIDEGVTYDIIVDVDKKELRIDVKITTKRIICVTNGKR